MSKEAVEWTVLRVREDLNFIGSVEDMIIYQTVSPPTDWVQCGGQ